MDSETFVRDVSNVVKMLDVKKTNIDGKCFPFQWKFLFLLSNGFFQINC